MNGVNEKLKYLAKTVSGYPGLNFSEANFAAYLEAFQDKKDQDFINALNRAMQESPTFFPPLPAVMKCFKQNEINEIRAKRAADLEKQLQKRHDKLHDYRIAAAQVEGLNSTKAPGWLYNLFKQKREEKKAKL